MAYQPPYLDRGNLSSNTSSMYISHAMNHSTKYGLFPSSPSLEFNSTQSQFSVDNGIFSDPSLDRTYHHPSTMPYGGGHAGDPRNYLNLNHAAPFHPANVDSRYQQSLPGSGSYGSFRPSQDRPSPSSGSEQTGQSQVGSLQDGASVDDSHVSTHQYDSSEPNNQDSKPKKSKWSEAEVDALLSLGKAPGIADWDAIADKINTIFHHNNGHYRTSDACSKAFYAQKNKRAKKQPRTYPPNRAPRGQGKRTKQEVEVKPAREKTAKITKTAKREQTSKRATTSKRKKATTSGEDEVPAAGANFAQPSLSLTPEYTHGNGRIQTSDYFFFEPKAYEGAAGPAPYPMGGLEVAQSPESPFIDYDYASTSNSSIGCASSGVGIFFGPEFTPTGAYSHNNFY